jgi:hypothetical protein
VHVVHVEVPHASESQLAPVSEAAESFVATSAPASVASEWASGAVVSSTEGVELHAVATLKGSIRTRRVLMVIFDRCKHEGCRRRESPALCAVDRNDMAPISAL